MTELVHFGLTDGVATITLDSPHNRNALSRQLLTELFDALDRAEEDPDARVVLIRSADRVFCSGADLSEAAGGGMDEGPGRSSRCSGASSPTRRWCRGSAARSGRVVSASSPPATSCCAVTT